MMRFAAFVFFGVALASGQALDLTPTRAYRGGNEGEPTPILQFANGVGRVEYAPPPGWEVSGGGNELSFFTSEATSWMKLQVIPKSKEQLQATVSLSQDDLQKWAAQFMPPRAEGVAFEKVVPAPYHLGQRLSTEFVFSFTCDGTKSLISVSFVDYGREWLVMSVSAKAKSFAQIRQTAIGSMFGWSEEG